jgi:hypothetical protein
VLKDPLASDSAVILNSREAAMGPSLKISPGCAVWPKSARFSS